VDIKLDKNLLLKKFLTSLIIMIVVFLLERITGGDRFSIVVAVTSLIMITIALYIGHFQPKAAYFTGVLVGFISLVLLIIFWAILGVIIYLIFEIDITKLYIDLENFGIFLGNG